MQAPELLFDPSLIGQESYGVHQVCLLYRLGEIEFVYFYGVRDNMMSHTRYGVHQVCHLYRLGDIYIEFLIFR